MLDARMERHKGVKGYDVGQVYQHQALHFYTTLSSVPMRQSKCQC